MRIKENVRKNSLLLSSGYILGRLLAFLVFRRLTHLAGNEGAGAWGVAVELTGILVVVGSFGLDNLITREIIKQPARRAGIFFAAVRLRAFTGLGGYLLLMGFLQVSGYDPTTRQAVMIMALGLFFEIWAMAGDAVFQAREKVQLQTASQVLAALVYFGLSWYWLGQGWGLMGIVWASLISRASRLVVVAILLRPILGGSATGAKVSTRWLAAMAWPLFLASTLGVMALKIDTMLVMAMLGKAETGVYTAGRRLLDLMMLAPHFIAIAVFPSLQRSHLKSKGKDLQGLQVAATETLRWIMLVSAPLAVGGIVAAGPLIKLLIRGSGFEGSVPVLRVVMLGLPLISATYLGNRLVLALGRDHLFMRVSLVALVVNVGVNLGLVPVWGVQGAGAALVISLLSAWLVYRNILIREGLRLPMVRELSRALTLTLVSWGLTVFILGKVKPSWDLDWSGIHTASLPALAVTALMVLAFYLGLVRVVGLKPGPIRS